jgi:2,4-dienoyl-CoA reductase-like NADH-dependent reductase (Old Yellow Enzyme family)
MAPKDRVDAVSGHLSPPVGIFSPISLGGTPSLKLEHRLVMASMARHRVEMDGTPKADVVGEYYFQRATPGGLILTEATVIHPEGNAAPRCPGIWTDTHVEAWKKIVKRTMEKNPVFFMQVR